MPQIKKNKAEKTYWRSLQDKMNSKEIESFIVNEFPRPDCEFIMNS